MLKTIKETIIYIALVILLLLLLPITMIIRFIGYIKRRITDARRHKQKTVSRNI